MVRKSVLVSLCAATLAGGLAACGSTGAPSGTVTNAGSPSPGGANAGLQFARCMRAHGVSNFPDPSAHGPQISPLDAQSPAFQTAQSACKEYLPDDGQFPGTSPAARQRAVAFARCMRAHGESDFPDPALNPPSAAGPNTAIISLHGMVFVLGPGLSPRSPAFQQAAGQCGIRLPGAAKAPAG